MTPATVHRLAQEIRHRRELLRAEEVWLQKQPRSETRAEGFRHINFWREVLKLAEQKLINEGDTESVAIVS